MKTKYIKGITESMLGEGVIYTEFEDEFAIRQVENYDGQWYSSRDEYHDGVGQSLYDGKLSDLDLSNSIEITKMEFESVWLESN
jgi:hypothetical protein